MDRPIGNLLIVRSRRSMVLYLLFHEIFIFHDNFFYLRIEICIETIAGFFNTLYFFTD